MAAPAACTTQQRPFLQGAQPLRPSLAARRAAPRAQAANRTVCAAQSGDASRRQALQLATVLAAAPLLATEATAAKGPKGFSVVKDQQDAYSFLYPFGWQEVQIDGQDIVYKDVIEPLESVSVGLIPTDKATVNEFGDVRDVAFALADKVLTSPTQEIQLINAEERTLEGRTYYDFEFVAKSKNYTRHAAASVTVGNGKFYTLLTGSNERRWSKMSDKVNTIVKSFTVDNRY